MPARLASRGTVGAVVFAGAAAVAVLGLPAAGESVGVAAVVPVRAAVAPVSEGAVAAFLAAPASEPASAAPTTTPAPDPATPTDADLEAGILRREVAESGGGEFDVVAGSSPAPGRGPVQTLRVEVERGLPVDGDRFAAFAFATLNDPRGWGHDGAMTFARTDGPAPVDLILATPETSARLCGDLDTRGMVSCRNGRNVVLTFYRWVNGTDEYTDDLTGYRRYLVNHEVGHALGHGHERCPGAGRTAPVMQQQTLGLKGCTQNSWPYPDGAATGP